MIVTTKAATIAAERQGTEQAAATRAERATHRRWHRVLVCLAGAVFEDAVRGFDREEAMREAEANWCTHTRYTPGDLGPVLRARRAGRARVAVAIRTGTPRISASGTRSTGWRCELPWPCLPSGTAALSQGVRQAGGPCEHLV